MVSKGENKNNEMSGLKGWLFFIPVLFVLAILIMVLSYLFLPVIQESVNKYVINTLNEQFKGSFEYSELSIKGKHLVIDDFVWYGHCQDTVAALDQISMDLDLNVRDLFSRQISFNNVNLQNGFFLQRIFLGDSLPSVVLAFEDNNKKTGNKTSRFKLVFTDISVANFCYKIEDENNATQLNFCTGDTHIDKIEFNNHINEMLIESPKSDDFSILYATYPKPDIEVRYPSIDTSFKYMGLTIQNADIKNSKLSIHNWSQEMTKELMDLNHLVFTDWKLELSSFRKYLSQFSAEHIFLSGKGVKDWSINSFTIDSMYLDERGSRWEHAILSTAESELKFEMEMEHLGAGFASFQDFSNLVKIKAISKKTKLSPKDIFAWSINSRSNKFLRNNKNEEFEFSGTFNGTLNKMRIRDIEARLGRGTKMKGQLTLRDMTNDYPLFLGLRIDRLSSNSSNFMLAFPDLNLPDNLRELGQFSFSGTYDGTASNFVAFGKLESEIGKLKLDLSMRDMTSNKIPHYSGQLEVRDFDLSQWSQNDQLGRVDFNAQLSEGKGFDMEELEAKVEAQISRLDYNDYSYRNIKYTGIFSKSKLIGSGEIMDKNIHMIYDGDIKIRDKNYLFNSRVSIENMALKQLNLHKEPFIISAESDLNFKTNAFLDFIGYAKFNNLNLSYLKEEYDLKNLNIYSLEYGEGQHLNIIGDGFEARLDGNFNIKNLHKPVINSLYNKSPALRYALDLPKYSLLDSVTSDMEINLQIDSLVGWTKLLVPNLNRMVDFDAQIKYKEEFDYLEILADVPQVRLGSNVFYGNTFNFSLREEDAHLEVRSDSLQLGNQKVPNINLVFDSNNRDISFAAYSTNYYDFIDHANFNGNIKVQDDGFSFHLQRGFLTLLNELWYVKKENSFLIEGMNLSTNNFTLTNGKRQISIKSGVDNAFDFDFKNFDISLLNRFVPIEAIRLKGDTDIKVSVGDLAQRKDITISGMSDSIFVNKTNYGQLDFSAHADSFNDDLQGDLSIKKENQKLISNIQYSLGAIDTLQSKNAIEIITVIESYPISIIEDIVGSGILNTLGKYSAQFSLVGEPGALAMNGQLTIDTFASTISYLNTRVHASSQSFTLNESYISCANCIIYDRENNISRLRGGLRHQNFKDLKYDVELSSENFIVLDTDKGDNQYFYGKAYGGNIDARIKGELSKPEMVVSATSNMGSHLFFPLTSDRVSPERSFIRFMESNNQNDQVEIANSAFKFDLSLDVTEAAQVDIIFDETAGDQITARGRGNIALEYTEAGEVKVYGNYDISDGKYLFTYLNFVNKPFILREGSNLQFNGSPYEAILNVTADYSGLSTPVYPLIQEFLSESQTAELSLAKSPTPVDLSMILKGELLQPLIDFDISFPQLDRQLRNYTDSKIAALKNSPNALNTQVFGLLVVGTFLPSQQGQGQLQGTQYIIGLNTVSQMISNQLSNYITGLIGDLFLKDDALVSGFELDLNYSFYANTNSVGSPLGSSEFMFRPRFYLLDDRVTLDIGGNINNGASAQGNNQLTGNFVLGIDITEDRKWRFRAYQRFEPEFDGSDQSKTGLGISYRSEFDSFKDMVKRMNKKHKELSGQ